MKHVKYLLEIVVTLLAISFIIAAAIVFFYSASCATVMSNDVDEDPIIFKICLESCSDRYLNNQGTKHYERISPDLIRCVCITPNGDHRIYINYKESSVDGKTKVIVE